MYICICNALRDRELAEAAAQPGVRNAACVFKACQSRPKCGNCVPDIDEMIASNQSTPALLAAE
ncbi:(2Fe-2S)-binding protein [Hyphobacterium sp.]|jgi:bacterioferritin-associated ferredoxin|uniref:(2Fe-2S)-binding protein n=1 Tax=Hyphobacterium sp. TaxID=2004662 RepID=UPI003BAB3525